MKNPPDKPHELEVSRADLLTQLKFLSKAMGKSTKSVILRFQGGTLVIEAGESTVEIFARGDWPVAINNGCYMGPCTCKEDARRGPSSLTRSGRKALRQRIFRAMRVRIGRTAADP